MNTRVLLCTCADTETQRSQLMSSRMHVADLPVLELNHNDEGNEQTNHVPNHGGIEDGLGVGNVGAAVRPHVHTASKRVVTQQQGKKNSCVRRYNTNKERKEQRLSVAAPPRGNVSTVVFHSQTTANGRVANQKEIEHAANSSKDALDSGSGGGGGGAAQPPHVPGSTMSPSPRMENVGSVSAVPAVIWNMSLMGPSMFLATPIMTGVKNTQ